MGNYDHIDASFGYNGDFDLHGGDLKTTVSDALQSVLDQIHTVTASSVNDWLIYSKKGATLDDFVGEPNTRETGNAIRNRVYMALVSAEIVNASDLEVKVIPVHINKVLIIVRIKALSSPYNRLKEGEMLQTSIIFDSSEKQVFFLDTASLINSI